MAGFKTFRVVTLTATVAHSMTLGTTGTPSAPWSYANKGIEVTFQNQSTAATNIWVGPSDVVPSIGATSTLGTGGHIIAQNGFITFRAQSNGSGIKMEEWYVASTSSNGICFATLLHHA